jgi:hypothetical protein
VISISTEQHPDVYEFDSCVVIYETAKAVYEEEIDRFKNIETKTNIALAFAGIFLGIFITFTSTNTTGSPNAGYLIYSTLFKALVFGFFITSAVYFYRSLRSESYEQLDLENIVDKETSTGSGTSAYLSIASTYRNAVAANKAKINNKTRLYDKGLGYISISFLVFILHFIIEVVIGYV